jgi:IMP cyclohydrolase
MYVGRIVAVGRTDKGRNVVGYRVSSRSFPNRHVVVTAQGHAAVVPRPGHEADLAKNPYIAYNCVRVAGTVIDSKPTSVAVATNGSHTDPIAEKIASGMNIRDAMVLALMTLDYEKDDFDTPRIAVAVEKTGDVGWAGVVRRDGLHVRSLPLVPGKLYYFATYEIADPQPDRVSEFGVRSVAQAAKWLVDGGAFADLEKPVCAAACMAQDDAFETAYHNVGE